MADTRPLVNKKEVFSGLLDHPGDARYKEICSQFAFVRKIQGDGNCFYRALCFGHLESELENGRALQRFKDTLLLSERELLSAGFDESSFKDLLNVFLDVLGQCEAGGQEGTLLRLFNEKTTSNSLVQYLRLLTSAYLQNHADFFSHFVEAPNLKVYCTQEVETMAMECDHVDILALSEALGIGIHIVSMERSDKQQLVHHTIPEGATPSLHLLYKASHYDILYPHTSH
ncbi:ubiquitin thioesterase OTUB2-like [Osmerus mordax]|uniref:ubiquitin thioesterase OTUB2-like n=1 Tax=Osmerus mordax TaxID=8014 RepID=UPI00350F3A38